MSKQRHDASSNDLLKNLHAFSEDETNNVSPADKDEMVSLLTGPEDEGPLPDNARVGRGITKAYENITGKRWGDSSLLILLLVYGLCCMIYWNLPKNEPVIVWQDTEFTTTAEQEGTLADTEHVKDKDSELPVRTRSSKDPDNNRRIAPINDSVSYSNQQPVYTDILNSYKKEPVMVLDKLKLPESITSSTSEHSYLHHDIKPGDLISRYSASGYSDKQLTDTEFNNWYKELESELNKSGRLNIKNSSSINKTRLLETYVHGYNKTGIQLEKDRVVFISCHGTVSSSDCDLTFGPAGVNSIPENADCERLIKNYPLGALLFRLNDQEEWKLYSSPDYGIKAEKDGILEFTINYKLRNVNSLSGKFLVIVFSSK